MAENLPTNKAGMMQFIAQSWDELNDALDGLTEEQATGIKDENGWTVKDHVIHMAAWERSIVYMLNRKPRHEGLGVSEQVYLEGNDDSINAAIYTERHDMPLAEAREQFTSTHQELMAIVEPMSEDELGKPYRYFLPDEPRPDEPRDGDGPPAYGMLMGNTAGHFKEHLEWIKSLVGNE